MILKNNDNKKEGLYRPIKSEDCDPGVHADLLSFGFKETHFTQWSIKASQVPTITAEHVKLVEFLLDKKSDLPKPDRLLAVINEINQLNSIEAKMLRNLYDVGLRNHHLIQCTKVGKEERLSSSEESIWAYLLQEKKLPPDEVVNELQGLSILQMRTLKKFYDLGLRGEHLRNWHPPRQQGLFGIKFSELHANTLGHLLKINHIPPEVAIAVISDIPVKVLENPTMLNKRIKQFEAELAPAADFTALKPS